MTGKEDFVTYRQAKTLKELGFDWKTHAFYNKEGDLYSSDNPDYWNDEIWNEFSAPTLEQTQKWLRETKELVVIVLFSPKDKGYYWRLFYEQTIITGGWVIEYCNTYEKALLEGINDALKILKKEHKWI